MFMPVQHHESGSKGRPGCAAKCQFSLRFESSACVPVLAPPQEGSSRRPFTCRHHNFFHRAVRRRGYTSPTVASFIVSMDRWRRTSMSECIAALIGDCQRRPRYTKCQINVTLPNTANTTTATQATQPPGA